jgi:ATP synthase protein I
MQAEKLMQIAVLLPASACVGWLIGGWADRHLHQTWIGLVGILVGGILGLVYVIRLVMTNPGTKQGVAGSGAAGKNEKEESKTGE